MMKKRNLTSFLQENIKTFKFENLKNKKRFLIINLLYVILAFILLASSTFDFNQLSLPLDTLRGIIAQFQIIILFYLSLNFSEKGVITAWFLNAFSLSSFLSIMIIENNMLYMPGLIAYLTVAIIIYFIYRYQQELNSKVKELKKEKKKLEYMAYYDNLTEIANRALLIERLGYLSSMSKQEAINYKLIFIDFKNFKRINDSWGYHIGDDILKEIASRLNEITNENDLIARLGGDEFAIVVPRELTNKKLERYIRKIKRKLEITYKSGEREINLKAVFGIARFPKDGQNSKEIIKSADIAIYKAKNSMDKEIAFFAKDMEKDVLVDVQMEEALKKAIKNEEFHLLFQPQYKTNGKKLRGFEALIRWHSPENGTISPGRFIPVAEKTALIKEIGNWVLKTAIKKVKTIQKEIEGEPVLSINISVVQLTDPNFVEQVKNIVKQEKIEGFQLEFEITESLFISDQEYVIDVLYKLKDLGISIAMDDFGTGYASLSYLQHIPLDILKIDKAFIDLITQSSGERLENEKMMIPPIIEMAHEWGIKVVAEGVENIEQLHYLEDQNCDFIQGFLLNKPLDEDQITHIF